MFEKFLDAVVVLVSLNFCPIEIFPRQVHRTENHLKRTVEALPEEGAAQHIVTFGDELPGAAESLNVERPFDFTAQLFEIGVRLWIDYASEKHSRLQG